jgi:hypothetical protein
MKNLIEYLKEQGAVKCELVNGPNGKFISATKADDSKFTLPVGKKSQAGRLDEFNVLIAENGTAIATVNHYEVAETISLV